MKTVVFVGPTVAPARVRSVLPDADVRGPVACGDVLRATREAEVPATIAIVDGVFEHSLPVWHKEILWALSRGCRVYGASSMGALRASELSAFGMVGVGQIFEWYRDGVLEDDDDVAVAHEDHSRSYRALSDAMVNVRATLAQAVRMAVIDAPAASLLTATVKAMPYPQRNLRRAVADASLAAPMRGAFMEWLERNGIVDQKRADAEALLERVATDQRDRHPAGASFCFSYTEVFHELARSLDAPTAGGPTPGVRSVSSDDLLEELQLGGVDQFRGCWQGALERALTRTLAAAGEDPGAAQQVALTELPAVLRDRGLLEALATRAGQKSALLASESLPRVRVASADLLAWHFSTLARPLPDDVDAYARSIGLEDQNALILAIARERWYVDRQRSGGS